MEAAQAEPEAWAHPAVQGMEEQEAVPMEAANHRLGEQARLETRWPGEECGGFSPWNVMEPLPGIERLPHVLH